MPPALADAGESRLTQSLLELVTEDDADHQVAVL